MSYPRANFSAKLGSIVAHGLPAMGAFLLPTILVLASLWALWSVAIDCESTACPSPFSSLLDDRYSLRAVQFTLMQAVLSALLSTLFAIPLARALAHRSFPGRRLLLSLFGAPFILPVIVAVLGILAIWGNIGLINQILDGLGFAKFSIFGLTGILLAHVFFNLPLATRLFLQGWLAIPTEHWRLASQLDMDSKTIARHIEWPMLKERIPAVFALIFLLCITSFTVVLALGGGPKATTIELAIYQAIRFDFDLSRAALLALTQIVLCAGFALVARLATKDHDSGQSLGGLIQRPDLASKRRRILDGTIIAIAIIFLGLPLFAALLRGGLSLLQSPPVLIDLMAAILRSLLVAIGASLIMLAVALPLARLALHNQGLWKRVVELPGFAIMVAPPIAMGAGLFILLHNHVPVDDMALPLTALLNGLQSVPFALILLSPAMQQTHTNYHRLMNQLDLSGVSALRHIYWPLLRKPIGLSLGITAALSVGDLGVIALFGSPSEPTLPLYLYQQMGAYKIEQAYGTGLILTTMAFVLFLIFDRGVGGHDHSR